MFIKITAPLKSTLKENLWTCITKYIDKDVDFIVILAEFAINSLYVFWVKRCIR